MLIRKDENIKLEYTKYKNTKIIKRKDGRWQGKVYIDNNPKYIYGKTQKECYLKVKEAYPEQKKKETKITTFYDYWQEYYTKYKEPFYKYTTIKNYKSVFNNQIKPNFKDKNIKLITALELNNLTNKLENTRMKEYTCQYLREIFKQAYKDNKIKYDIWEDIKVYHHKRKEGTALSEEQRKIIINKARNTIYDIFIFYLYTGCRPHEALIVSKNDFEKDKLHIRGTKTQTADRWIPIFKPIVELYNKYKNNDTQTLFNISDTTLKRRRIDFQNICGFKFKTKDLRTTFATMCAEKGISEQIIAKWLGHTTTGTTKKYYIKVLTEFEKKEAEKIDTNFDT